MRKWEGWWEAAKNGKNNKKGENSHSWLKGKKTCSQEVEMQRLKE